MAHRMLAVLLLAASSLIPLNLYAAEPGPSTTAPPAAAPAPAKSGAVAIKDIVFEPTSLKVLTDGKLSSFSSFRLAKPARLVIDLPGVTNQLRNQAYPSDVPPVSAVNVISYPDKLRLIVEANQRQEFPEGGIESTPSGLIVDLSGKGRSQSNFPQTSYSAPPAFVPYDNRPAIGEGRAAASSKAAAIPRGRSAAVEKIDFQVVEGISRVSVKVLGDIDADQPEQTPGFVTLTIRNASLPQHLQRSLETGSFPSPVLRITPLVVKHKNSSDAVIRIAMRVAATFEFRREGDVLYVDIKNPEGLMAGSVGFDRPAENPIAENEKFIKPIQLTPKPKETDVTGDSFTDRSGTAKPITTSEKSNNPRVTLEFADAEVRKIFQLLAEVSKKNFVLGDDVTGIISLKLVNVPWEEALDVILDTKGLDKQEKGNIVLIKGKGKFKTQAEEELEKKKVAAKAIELKTESFSVNYATIGEVTGQFEKLKTPERGQISSDTRTNKVIVKDTPQALDDMRNLLLQLDIPEKQVMIEARIVEASTDFSKNLGVNWGLHFKDGSASIAGVNQLDTGFGGITSAPPLSGTGTEHGGSMGISFGTLGSNIQLDLKINAAAAMGQLKIISSPRVATVNHKRAEISQGRSVQRTVTTNGNIGQKEDKADLKLTVEPHINNNNTILMKIEATNDEFQSSTDEKTTKKAITELVLKDGETTVIGGIYKDSESSGEKGVPFLMDMPFLGRLFRSSSYSVVRTELLVFVTPRILNSNFSKTP
ncbi:MAG TPA: type IV pilus secretin PilQ [Desulfuromonadales bacterium]|nr:type IV pilus secretin PilQ [Desulfuromonadales bacterium]